MFISKCELYCTTSFVVITEPVQDITPWRMPEIQTSPVPRHLDMSFNSPKWPPPREDFNHGSDRPRKFVGVEFPLQATNGRRLDKPTMIPGTPTPRGDSATQHHPHASAYNILRLSSEKKFDLIRRPGIPARTSQIPIPTNVSPASTSRTIFSASCLFFLILFTSNSFIIQDSRPSRVVH